MRYSSIYQLFILFILMLPMEMLAGERIVILGSSTAEGAGVKVPGNSWVCRYAQYLKSVDNGYEIINLAKGGYTTFAIMPLGTPAYDTGTHVLTVDSLRNIDKALSYSPDIIIINMPTNDVSNGIPVSVQLSNFRTIVDKARSKNVKVWITTSQPHNFGEEYTPPYTKSHRPDASKQKFRNQFKLLSDEILKQYGDYAIDFYTGLVSGDSCGFIKPIYDSGDGVHLNDEAHAVLFERVKNRIGLD